MSLAALSLAGKSRSQRTRNYRRFGAGQITQPRAKNRVGNFGMLLAVSIFSSVVFVAGLMPGTMEAPQLWTHAFIALTLAQFVMLGGATLKATARRHGGTEAASIAHEEKLSRAMANVDLSENIAAQLADIRPSMQPIAMATGLLGEKTYVAFSDGSIEVDTMLGRRRFADLNAAREFVGA